VTPDGVHELVLQSLRAWRVSGDVSREADGALLVTAAKSVCASRGAGPTCRSAGWVPRASAIAVHPPSLASCARCGPRSIPATGPVRLRIAPCRRALMIPVAVLTGFLGSGKTTLLGRLLRHPTSRARP